MISGAGAPPAYTPPTEFRVGEIFGKSFNVLALHFVPFIAISALAGLPSLLFALQPKPSSGQSWLQLTVDLVLSSVCEAMILYATFQALRGRAVRIGESMAIGLRRFVPVVIASLAAAVAEGVGLLLLVVPGLIAMVMFAVAEPAIVVERLGPFEGLSRSIELTRGYRWSIFGLLFVVGLVEAVVGAIVGVTLRPGFLAWYTIAIYVVGTLGRAYLSVLVAIVYHDLRVLKEGIDLDQIAAVFD